MTDRLDKRAIFLALQRMTPEDRRDLLLGEPVYGRHGTQQAVKVLQDMMAGLQRANRQSLLDDAEPRMIARDRAAGYLARAIRCLKAVSA